VQPADKRIAVALQLRLRDGANICASASAAPVCSAHCASSKPSSRRSAPLLLGRLGTRSGRRHHDTSPAIHLRIVVALAAVGVELNIIWVQFAHAAQQAAFTVYRHPPHAQNGMVWALLYAPLI
jgi:hypothetical protein